MDPSTIPQISDEAIENLKARLRGKLILPDHADYESARTVWNGMIDKYPAIIVRCAGTADVITAVQFARQYNLTVAVRGGGHSFAGNAVCDDGLVIDLSGMRSVHVDPFRQIARVEGGALMSDLDHETQAFGLAVPSGTVSHTGIGGLTLGGGQGWLMNKYGLTCDNLLSVDLVTADGQLLTVNQDEYPDLFWGIRGGGGNFGIATSFEYQLYPVGPSILGGMILYSIDQASDVLRFYRDFSMNAPDELSLIAALLCLPDGTPAIALVAGWCGSIETGEIALTSLRSFGTPIVDLIDTILYNQLQKLLDASVPHGLHRYCKMGYLPEISNTLIEYVIDLYEQKTSPYSMILFNVMRGAVCRVNPDDTAFPHRHPQWYFDIVAQWVNPDEAAIHQNWVRQGWQATKVFTHGTNTNFLDSDDGLSRVKDAYGANYDRLVALKTKYDPGNFFRLNNNITPSEYSS